MYKEKNKAYRKKQRTKTCGKNNKYKKKRNNFLVCALGAFM